MTRKNPANTLTPNARQIASKASSNTLTRHREVPPEANTTGTADDAKSAEATNLEATASPQKIVEDATPVSDLRNGPMSQSLQDTFDVLLRLESSDLLFVIKGVLAKRVEIARQLTPQLNQISLNPLVPHASRPPPPTPGKPGAKRVVALLSPEAKANGRAEASTLSPLSPKRRESHLQCSDLSPESQSLSPLRQLQDTSEIKIKELEALIDERNLRIQTLQMELQSLRSRVMMAAAAPGTTSSSQVEMHVHSESTDLEPAVGVSGALAGMEPGEVLVNVGKGSVGFKENWSEDRDRRLDSEENIVKLGRASSRMAEEMMTRVDSALDTAQSESLEARTHPSLAQKSTSRLTISVKLTTEDLAPCVEDVMDHHLTNISDPVDFSSVSLSLKVGQGGAAGSTSRTSTGSTQSSTESHSGSIVQFGAPIFYVSEGEEYVSLDVERMGKTNHGCRVHYQTLDASAKSGLKYIAKEGVIEFKPGETSKQLEIEIVQDATFDTTLEFKVVLTKSEHAELGRYLYVARVKIIDDDTFPTNKYYEACICFPPQIEKIPKASLMFEYLKMNYKNPAVRQGTLKMLLADQLHNIYFIWSLFLRLYMVDYVLNSEWPEEGLLIPNRTYMLIAIMLAVILPYAIVHYFDFRKCYWKVGGSSRKILQANLLRKFLNYDFVSRNHISESDLIMGMTRDTEKLVTEGYMQILPLFRYLGQLLFMMIMLCFTYIPSLLPSIVFPMLMFTFLRARLLKTTQALQKQNELQNGLVEHVVDSVTNYRLIADYSRRPYCVDRYEEKIGATNKAIVRAAAIMVNNKYFAPWLSTFLVGLYMLYGGLEVVRGFADGSGGLTLGQFLTNVNIFQAIGVAWGNIYVVSLQMQSAFPALVHIVTLMNLPTDVPKRLQLNRRLRLLSQMLTAEARRKVERSTSGRDKEVLYPIDLVKIVVKDLTFTYGDVQALTPCTFMLNQSSLVALVGKPGEGKSTLLKIIGGMLFPGKDDGQVFIPPHLRVLHVSRDPLFFEGTIYQNLTFGADPDDCSMERVMSICKALRIGPRALEYLETEMSSRKWSEVLSYSELATLNLARAFVTNPEVLCVHRPTLALDHATAMSVLHMLRTFVDEKGVRQDPAVKNHRRPRTCIITVSRYAGVELADQVLAVSKEFGVQRVDAGNVSSADIA